MRGWCRGHDAGCQIRLEQCKWGPTIGSHLPTGAAYKGIGYKPPDLLALACWWCHDVVDGRIDACMTRPMRLLAWYEGLFRTLVIAEREGVLVIK